MIGRVVNAIALALLILAAAGWFVFLRPTSLGGSATWIIVRGDSMLPTYQTGDLIVFAAAPSYAVGDVVAYRVPAGELGAGRIVMHRIVGGDANGLILQGDNNPAPDPWQPAVGDVVGAVWLVGPQLGRPIALLHQPALAAALAAAVMVAVVLSRRPASSDPQRAGGRTKVPLRTGRRSRVRVGTQPV
jgi:signal peptidase